MALSQDVKTQFAKMAIGDKKTKSEETINGTYKTIDGKEYVQLDGSDILTPVTSTVAAETGDRVKVLIKEHSAMITGNITSPSARSKDVSTLKDEVDKNGNAIKQMDNTITQQGNSIIQMDNKINQQNNVINQHNNVINQQGDQITSLNNTVIAQGNSIEATNNSILAQGNQIESMNNTIIQQGDNIISMNNNISAQGNKIDQQNNIISQQGNKIEQFGNNISEINSNLTVHDSSISVLNSAFVIKDGVVTGLNGIVVENLTSEVLDTRYAAIDFANIDLAAVERLFTKSGIIKDLVVADQHITGELVGVTIKGDLIEGNTIKADKLVVKGEDGLYYKLNMTAETVEAQQTDQNSLNGSVIAAKSITATKIDVKDLVAFGATIGGFIIDDNSIHTPTKNDINSDANGMYFKDDGQFNFGDEYNHIKYFKDTDGKWKLDITANELTLSSHSKTIEQELNEIREEVTTFLQIESSKGTVFKNNAVETLLSVAIYRGTDRITDMPTLKSKMGDNVYLQWKWKRMDEEEYGIISADDSRIGQDGFTFTLSPEDVDTKVTFLCELIS